MSRRGAVLLGLVGVLLMCAGRLMAQAGVGVSHAPLMDVAAFLGVSGFGMAAAALVSWGRHGRTVEDHSERIAELEDDRKARVTRDEFKSMQEDIREIRQMLERRTSPRV